MTLMGREKVLTLNESEQELIVKSLYDIRDRLLRKNDSANDVENLILRVIKAPTKKEKRREDRETR